MCGARCCAPAHRHKSDAKGEQRESCRHTPCTGMQSSWRPFPVSRDGQAAAPVKRARAGAGMRPCGPRARRLSGTPPSSSARCCSRSTAAAAGPPPSRRTGCGTCACMTGTLQSQSSPYSGHQPASGRLVLHARREPGALCTPAAHGAQRGHLQAQVLQGGLR